MKALHIKLIPVLLSEFRRYPDFPRYRKKSSEQRPMQGDLIKILIGHLCNPCLENTIVQMNEKYFLQHLKNILTLICPNLPPHRYYYWLFFLGTHCCCLPLLKMSVIGLRKFRKAKACYPVAE